MLPGKRYTFDDLVAIGKRRKWLVAMPLLLACLATVVALRFLPNKYRSETLILVVPQRVPESYVKATVTTRIDDRLQSISQQILSRTRLERIIADFDLYRHERQTGIMEDVVERMRADIRVQLVKGDAFKVTYVAGDPQVAFKVTERLASLFIEENLRDREGLAEATNQFIETQLEDARRRLVEQEQQLEQYRLRYAGQLPSELQSNLQIVQNTQLQIQALVDSTNRDHDRRLLLERAILAAENSPDEGRTSVSATDARDTAVQSAPSALSTQLDAARRTLRDMEARLTPKHPDLVSYRRFVAEIEAKVNVENAERAAAANDTAKAAAAARTSAARAAATAARRIDDLKSEMAALDLQIATKERQRQELESHASSYASRVAAVPVRESELTSLTRDYETLRRVYQDLLTKREESKVAANLERRQIGEQFKVLDPARAPEKPFSPNRPLMLGIGLCAGLAIGLALIAWLEYRDTSMRNEDDVAATVALPVMAAVPMMTTPADRRRLLLRTMLLSCVAATLMIVTGVLALKVSHLF
jgi:polysaccharide chain length determinant protein (PEP-CTERM system associated)